MPLSPARSAAPPLVTTLLAVAGISIAMTARASGHRLLSPLAMSCLACHEPAVDAATMPSLAVYSSAAIAASLRAARDQPQPGSIMARYAQFLTDAEIDALASELGSGKPDTAAGR